MRSKNNIQCPYCDEYYDITTDGTGDFNNDIWEYEGETLECRSCHKKFQIVDIENISYVTTRKIQ